MRILLIIVLVVTWQNLYAQEDILREKGTLTPTEKKLLQTVQGYYPDLHFSQSVTRHFVVNGKNKKLLKTSFNYKKVNGFYFKSFIFYEVELSANHKTISYAMSAGRALSQEGKINIWGESLKYGEITRTDYTYGTSAKTVTMWLRAKKVLEETKQF